MDAGDGWHVARGESSSQDKTIMNQIMLRFRPIAPKPVAVGSSSGTVSPDSKSGLLTSKRVKRKYIRVAKNNNNSTRRLINSKSSAEDKPETGLDTAVVTLQLMPEKTGCQDFPGTGSWCSSIDPTVVKISDNRELPTWMNINPKMNRSVGNQDMVGGTDQTAGMPQVMVVESWVTVESVTDTCMDVRGLGCTDVEKRNSLDKDTCPGFISDGSNRVQWVNEAYKRMVVQQKSYCNGQSCPAEVIVWLAAKADLPYAYPAFSCRVRLQYYKWPKEKCSKMVPCDVWRMDDGLAWRLDIKAALSLGL